VTTFNIQALNKEGFVVEFSGDFLTEYTPTLSMLTDPDFGYVPAQVSVKEVQPTRGGGVAGPLSCQFCGKDVKAVTYGNKDYTAEYTANSRAEKMGKMGRGEAKPVCGDCWTSGGHNKAWDKYYAANK
jgi:hypothetical protein